MTYLSIIKAVAEAAGFAPAEIRSIKGCQCRERIWARYTAAAFIRILLPDLSTGEISFALGYSAACKADGVLTRFKELRRDPAFRSFLNSLQHKLPPEFIAALTPKESTSSAAA